MSFEISEVKPTQSNGTENTGTVTAQIKNQVNYMSKDDDSSDQAIKSDKEAGEHLF